MKFEEMELRAELLQALEEQEYQQPTPIQEQGIPQVLAGRDLICCAQTGTGKTAAFALPILHRLAESGRADIRALVLVPTRELALQVTKSFQDYGMHLDLVTTAIYGGVPIGPQERILRQGVDILVATPGRLKDHVWRGNIDFRHTRYLVLDEADRMLDMGFIKAVQELVDLLPEGRQSMLFSATLDQEIRRFAKGILKDPLRIEVSPPSSTLEEIDQFLVRTSRQRKRSTLESLIGRQSMSRAIVFARTKSGASRLALQLREHGHNATAIHSDRSQADRVRALEGFREGKITILVATDIAARGIDVDDISHVVNYDLPHTAKDYVHRIGRTARAGRRGMAISLVTPEDAGGVASIERLIAKKLSWLDEPMSASEVTAWEEGAADAQRGNGGRADGNRRTGERTGRSRAGTGRGDGSRAASDRAGGTRGNGGRASASRDDRGRESRGREDSDRRRTPTHGQSGSTSGRRPRQDQPEQGRTPARRSEAPARPSRRPASRETPRAASSTRGRSGGRRSAVLIGYHKRSLNEGTEEPKPAENPGLVRSALRSLKSRLFS